MRKTLVCILFALMALCGRAGLPFAEVNSTWNVSLIGGYVGYDDKIDYGAIGVSATIKGFYVDFMGLPPRHSKEVRLDKWNDKKSFLCHAGYQIPIVGAFRIIPIIGYAYISTGITDGWNWSVNDNGIYNKFRSLKNVSRLDYGGIMAFRYRRALFSVGATRTSLFGGIGIEM